MQITVKMHLLVVQTWTWTFKGELPAPHGVEKFWQIFGGS